MHANDIIGKMRNINLRDYKIVCGAMSWISDPTLVAAVSNSNIKGCKALGVLAVGAMQPAELDLALQQVKKQTNEIFAVNLIGMSPYYDQLLNICAQHKVPIIILAATIPRKDKIDEIKKTGALVLGFATSLSIARNMIANGIDGIILEGSEAGGHVGSISTSVLIQEILFDIANDIPTIVAGGIGSPQMIKHYMAMGASGVQLGTRFVCAKESPMHPICKEFYIKKTAKDTTVVGPLDPIFSVIPVRVIRNRAVQEFYNRQRVAIKQLELGEIDEKQAQLMIEHFWSGSLKKGVLEGDIENGSLMAGQSISFVNSIESVQEIIEKLYDGT